jgi:hypothetical protein
MHRQRPSPRVPLGAVTAAQARGPSGSTPYCPHRNLSVINIGHNALLCQLLALQPMIELMD